MIPHIRWMIRRDMPEVLDIEEQSYQSPWTEEGFLHFLRARNTIAMVAEHGEKVVGFMVYELCAGMLVLHNLAVHPGYLRQGIGSRLLSKLKTKLCTKRRDRIILDISDRNESGHLWLRANGFKATNVWRNIYSDGRDGYRFMWEVQG